MNFSHQEFRRFNELVAGMYHLAFQLGPLPAISRVLPELVGGVAAAASMGQEQIGRLDMCFSEPEFLDAARVVPQEVFFSHPRNERRVPRGEVLMISDLVGKRAWRNRELYQNMLPWVRLEDDLGVDLWLADGSLFKACVIRDSHSFREEDRERFRALLPHLKTLLARSGQPATETQALGALGLTRREQEVLFWLMEGKTNREIGEILHIALGTVKIHLEHIYEKLGVENRHGAARRMLDRAQAAEAGWRE